MSCGTKYKNIILVIEYYIYPEHVQKDNFNTSLVLQSVSEIQT